MDNNERTKEFSDAGDGEELSFHDSEELVREAREKWRNLIAFWFLGLCNNFGYVVMLSAAYDILKKQDDSNEPKPTDAPPGFHCNPISTGLILLADILPTLLIKITAPFYMQQINYHIRVFTCITLLVASLLTVAYSSSVGVSILGVVFASLSSGIGEITFLAFTSYFKKSTISAWSSGTGMAGIAGAIAYAGLIQVGFTPHQTLLLLLIVPFIWAMVFWVLLKMPEQYTICQRTEASENEPLICDPNNTDRASYLSIKEKFRIMIPLLKYMIPLFLVYLAEYMINQGLYELLYYNCWLNQAQQYRWYQVDYQVGVFISRSSVRIFPIKKIYIPTIIQWLILGFLIAEVWVSFIPTIWITFAVIFLEGLCGGSVYVNAFTLISEEVPAVHKEFSLGASSMADSIGISIAGGVALPLHDALCSLKKKQ